MPITDELRALGNRVSRELDAVHDYFEHSKLVWRSFEDLVDRGYVVHFTNLPTGTAIDQAGLLGLAPHYTRAYLATFTFRQFVSTFEVFLFDFLHQLLLHNPWQFSKSALQLETVLNAADREEIISAVLSKRLNDLRYETLREWFVTLNRAVKLDCP